IMHRGLPLDHTGLSQQHSLMPQSSIHDPPSSNPYSFLNSEEPTIPSASQLPHSPYHAELQFVNGVHMMGSDVHFPPTSPMNEDGPFHPFQSYAPFNTNTHSDFLILRRP